MVTKLKMLALPLFLALGACTSTSGDPCAGFRTIHPTSADMAVISDQLVGQILANNETGKALCGWRE